MSILEPLSGWLPYTAIIEEIVYVVEYLALF